MVGLSVGLSVTTVSPAKMAEPIVMQLGTLTLVGPGNHVFDRGPDPPSKAAMLRQNRGSPT